MPFTLKLTTAELSALSEALRYMQQELHEGAGRHSAALSRVQRKIGDVAGCGYGNEP